MRAIRVWANEDQTIKGTVWRHATYSLTLRALAHYVDDLFETPIAEGIRHANGLISSRGGWIEEHGTQTHSVRAQYWATSAYAEVAEKLDPAKYIIRIEGERSQSTLKEPGWLPFAVDSKWHMIIPARLYRMVVYILALLGLILALDGASYLPPVDSRVGRIIGIGFIVLAWYGVRKRRRHFPFSFKWANWGFAILALVVLLWDIADEVIKYLGPILNGTKHPS